MKGADQIRPSHPLLVLVLTALLAVPRPAHADPTPSPPAVTQTWRSTGTWGWAVLGTGLAVGAGLTTYGLTLDCADAERSCQRGASIAIWGGIGLAALTSAIGIAIVQAGQRHLQLAPAVSAFGDSRGGLVLRGTF